MPSSAMQAHLTLTNLMACSNKMLQVRYSSIPRWPNTSLRISAQVLHLGLFMPCWFVSPNLAGTVQLVKLYTEDMWAQKFWIWIAVLVWFFFSRQPTFVCQSCIHSFSLQMADTPPSLLDPNTVHAKMFWYLGTNLPFMFGRNTTFVKWGRD